MCTLGKCCAIAAVYWLKHYTHVMILGGWTSSKPGSVSFSFLEHLGDDLGQKSCMSINSHFNILSWILLMNATSSMLLIARFVVTNNV